MRGRRGQGSSDRVFHAHIVQIEFNAWHYQEGDLWASLVDHILRNLRFGEADDEAMVDERRDRMVRELQATEALQAAATERAAEAELQQAEQARRDELADQLTPGKILDAARASIRLDPNLQSQGNVLAQDLGLPALQRDALALQDTLREARRELAGAWAFMVPLFRAKGRSTRLVLLSLALGGPVVLGLGIQALLHQNELLAKIGGLVAGLGSFVVAAAKWIGGQAKWVRAARDRVEPLAQEVDRVVNKAIEAALVEQKKAVADKQAELDAIKQQQMRAEKERSDAAAQASALRSGLTALADDGLMRAFLNDRLEGGVYQQKLGFAALVRRDFERLSRRIEQVTVREEGGGLRDGELIINRIVLYIDDLDRCEMDRVVPVLRAAHLLLAFPAFVVVVGVDSRWVARCLEESAPSILLDDDGDTRRGVTPLDYLQKIFQIPIWLEPVPPDRRVHMVRELLRKPAKVLAPARSAEVPEKAPPENDDAPETSPEQTKAPSPDEAGPLVPPAGESAPPAAAAFPVTGPAHAIGQDRADEPGVDLNPRGLEITDGEYEFLGQLGRLLSSSPRAIKRFVNTYRLLNATLAQSGLPDEELEPREPEVRMLLLAVLVSMPDLARWLQAALHDPEAGNLHGTPLVDVMASRARSAPRAGGVASTPSAPAPSNGERAVSEWEEVLQWMEERGEPWKKLPAARVARWLDPVGRYTFNLTRSRYPAP